MRVEIDPALMQDPTKVALSWNVTYLGPSEMQLQLKFDNPLYISVEIEPDTLVINFDDEALFVSKQGIKIPEEHRTLRRTLSTQLP